MGIFLASCQKDSFDQSESENVETPNQGLSFRTGI